MNVKQPTAHIKHHALGPLHLLIGGESSVSKPP